MIILGLILLVVGYMLPIPILATLGWLCLAIGVLLLLFGSVAGRPVLGRRYWY